jgi:hypothetical protein
MVPMSQEARGLDAAARLVARLVACKDERSAAVVRRIGDEERAHVAVGCACTHAWPLHASLSLRLRAEMQRQHPWHIKLLPRCCLSANQTRNASSA